ncbi:type II CAAX prenyl endopeptidase Rce1 family protein [Acidicapsa dinghuensis]|uniref:Type II CAAX prenyl endopeptidase Rce1 family protein n=1 Tax=Acidicapsa dinghuensis TaxID=2218256 RepID=A0ABW1EFQ0_9BACT|nr:CPBP family intramembrane glutamic endopeptidase [Acidicapsa dinghuensis]
MEYLTVPIILAALVTLAPYFAIAFWGNSVTRSVQRWPILLRVLLPAVLCIPYLLVSISAERFQWQWLALYAVLPVAIAFLLTQARGIDVHKRGNWRDWLVLVPLGLAVDLRWFEAAWPAHLAVFNKIILLDAGMYGFIVLRELEGVGADLRIRLRDLWPGLREFLFYTPIAITLGLSMGFLHWHAVWSTPWWFAGAWIFTFLFIAVPEELFFRGWMQNLMERRIGRLPALLLTSILFGLSHWNKRTTGFNWQYVALAALAGIFYGRAWRQNRRVAASAITHATVDTVWSIWLH